MRLNSCAILKLCEEFTRIESNGDLAEFLDDLSKLTARILNASGCTILLLSEAEVAQAALHETDGRCALPARLRPGATEIAAPRVAEEVPLATTVRGAHGEMHGMVGTIMLHRKIIGVIHASGPIAANGFSKDDLELLAMLAPLVTKSIQVFQLQNILKSRFAQIALTKSNESTIGALISGAMQSPNQIARILAKSFYREMLNAGFNANQVISAATEVISELTVSLRKHKVNRKQRAKDRGDILALLLNADDEVQLPAPMPPTPVVQDSMAA